MSLPSAASNGTRTISVPRSATISPQRWSATAGVPATSFVETTVSLPESLVVTLHLGLLVLAIAAALPVLGRRRAVVGGLVVSQLLTLYITPVVYLYMDRLKARLRGPAKAGQFTGEWQGAK
mgnify:CR=1 FL=1